jgi:hypothetical protein
MAMGQTKIRLRHEMLDQQRIRPILILVWVLFFVPVEQSYAFPGRRHPKKVLLVLELQLHFVSGRTS